ncbi:putative UTP--hexose-1-phosphate uridylyltransferase [Lachnospiraceae bacterium oral taxon 082 str. F0431]|nr:putative UTP--hexose-1-phosphate uridylyltransferase [Lachnospiraceae bacterium oral taxon 082 str. F0431]
MINRLINELMHYALCEHLVDEDDKVFVTNSLLALFNQVEFHEEEIKEERVLADILKDMCDFALKEGIIEDDSVTVTDLFDTKIMGLLTPMPSTVRRVFKEIYSVDSKLATDYFYKLSKRSNYIRVDRIARDEKWVTDTAYGPIDITINLSKPEKDPRDIAKAGAAKKSGYPSCLLCMENEGYAGTFSHPARQNLRVIPIALDGEDYFLQYSPCVLQ